MTEATFFKWASAALLLAVAGLLIYQTWFRPETDYKASIEAVKADIDRLRSELAERHKLMDRQLVEMDTALKTLGEDLGTVRRTTAAGLRNINDKLTEIENAQSEIDALDAAALDAHLRELVRRYQAEHH